ncbi:MAG: hypothetical protein HHAS10_04130 [Candidatus Altimarinota bacterium]
MKLSKNTSGFTLVELVLSMTIFAVMMTTIISIYIQTTALSYRLKAARYLSETAREITEKISEDVKEYGMTGSTLVSAYSPWSTLNYSDGNEILGIGDGNKKYIYGIKELVGPNWTINPCNDPRKSDPREHCGLYEVIGSSAQSYQDAYNLVDSFIPEESKKRVKVKDLRFYISGDGIRTEKKVTLVLTLALMPRIGVPKLSVDNSTLSLQTTITARTFQKN